MEHQLATIEDYLDGIVWIELGGGFVDGEGKLIGYFH
jgi:hypothetical protein